MACILGLCNQESVSLMALNVYITGICNLGLVGNVEVVDRAAVFTTDPELLTTNDHEKHLQLSITEMQQFVNPLVNSTYTELTDGILVQGTNYDIHMIGMEDGVIVFVNQDNSRALAVAKTTNNHILIATGNGNHMQHFTWSFRTTITTMNADGL